MSLTGIFGFQFQSLILTASPDWGPDLIHINFIYYILYMFYIYLIYKIYILYNNPSIIFLLNINKNSECIYTPFTFLIEHILT